ncbi:MAG TPA: alpha/beta fold hydrolase, partial [Trueperaceae bacterium]|nr:alpha/beta fold hydrolase [Trueperaceae bacterium]
MPRAVIVALFLTLVVVLLVLAALFGLGWVLSSRVIVPVPYSLMPEFEILAVEPLEPIGGGAGPAPAGPAAAPREALAVTLPVLEDPNQHANTLVDGTYGLLWEGGYGLLGSQLSAAARAGGATAGDPSADAATADVIRAVTVVEGAVPAAGTPARIDNFVYRRNPRADFGIDYEELALAGDQGSLRAWYVPGGGRTAVLLLHGRRRGELIETLRMIQPLHELGLDVLALAYRNHDESAASSDGLYHYGASEWRDAVVGAKLLAERGADRVILFGLSMGGAVALEALERWSTELPEPIGVILDSPLVDPYATVELGAV